MAAANGFYLAPHVFVDDTGGIWRYADKPGLSGLSGTWEKIGEYFQPIVEAVGPAIATRIAGRHAEGTLAPPAGGVQVGATSQGLFGGIDTNTLLLLSGLGVGAFLIMKK